MSGPFDVITDPQVLVQALAQGVVYALLAMGVSLVFRTTRVLNFAHGQLLIVGVVVMYVLNTNPLRQVPYGVAALVGILVAMVLGMLLYPLAVLGRGKGIFVGVVVLFGLNALADIPFFVVALVATAVGVVAHRYLDRVSLARIGDESGLGGSFGWVLGTIAAATVLQEGLIAIVGAGSGEQLAIPSPLTGLGTIRIGDVVVPGVYVATGAIALVCVVLLDMLESRTRLGRAMKAVAHSEEAAALMGINVNRVIYGTFALAAASAVVAGLLVTPIRLPTLTSGPEFTLIALTAALLGGIDRVRGAALGGLLLGMFEIYLQQFLSLGSGRLLPLHDAIVVSLLIVVLVARPRGILGSPMSERTT